MNIIIMVLTACIFLLCFFLVFHKEYEDGLLGRIGLGLVGVAAFSRCMSLGDAVFFGGMPIVVSGTATLLWFGLYIFLARHTYRFLRWRCMGEYDWRPTHRHQAPGKVGEST